MSWVALYALLLVLLVVRVRTSAAPLPEPAVAAPGEPLRLVATHHALFYALLIGAPLEALVVGGDPAGRLPGAALFALGVGAYRMGGRALGDALSPFVAPRPGAPLVMGGPYRFLRHPMYVGQALIAVGAPLTLGCRWTLGLSAAAIAVLGVRVLMEEAALSRAFPEYTRYAAQTKRIVPFLY